MVLPQTRSCNKHHNHSTFQTPYKWGDYRFTEDYKEEVRKAFGDSAPEVLEYLFSEETTESDTVFVEEQEYVSHIDHNRVVEDLENLIAENRRYLRGDLVGDALRGTGYDDSMVSKPATYAWNLNRLEQEFVQKRLQRAYTKFVQEKFYDDNFYNKNDLEIISSLLYINSYAKLLQYNSHMKNTGWRQIGHLY